MTQLQAEYTFDDLLKQQDDGKLYELVRGQLVEKTMASLAMWIAWRISVLIGEYLKSDPRGWVLTEQPVNCFPWMGNHGRRPDVAYFDFDRHPGPNNKPITVAPNMAVEVLSPNDDAIELDVKVEEYFKAGIDLVWVVNPETKTVRAQLPDGSAHVFHEHDTITAEPVLPAFRISVRDFVNPPRKP
jgi:Uma2 family endonuclease